MPVGCISRGEDILWAEVSCASHFGDRLRGLLGKSHLNADAGLLLMHVSSIHSIGMAFPIDVIFLDQNKRVTACHSDLPAWRWRFCRAAVMTLEVAAGGISCYGVEPGQRLEWRPPLHDCAIQSKIHP
jgi:uncharacterized membrane protein (UPF0127 family)